VFDAEDTLLGSLASTATVVSNVQVYEARVNGAAGGFMLATDVADYLVGRGVPFRKAHEIVAGMVRTLIERGRSFESLSVEEWKALDAHFEADVVDKVTARQSVAARKTPQSTAPDAVASALADARKWVESVEAR
jgi:argininosuccinate lyase